MEVAGLKFNISPAYSSCQSRTCLYRSPDAWFIYFPFFYSWFFKQQKTGYEIISWKTAGKCLILQLNRYKITKIIENFKQVWNFLCSLKQDIKAMSTRMRSIKLTVPMTPLPVANECCWVHECCCSVAIQAVLSNVSWTWFLVPAHHTGSGYLDEDTEAGYAHYACELSTGWKGSVSHMVLVTSRFRGDNVLYC